MQHIESTLVNKINSLPELLQKVAQWKAEGQKLVFTNGVFDLIHTGHITYLAQAAELGHKLIIGLNSDASVKRLKGESRPVNNQDSRALLLSAFFYIDAIVVFEEDTPANLINAVMPDVLVKGGDYTIENIVGANEVMANGGEVKTINFVEGYSSTSIINKIRSHSS
ncbi:D-glycero-beta-D-manno-heptose 1-phosphate adenylyltransferase [Mucilaginibacter jinjuensis]|uniref:D-glycero-beta-D-manno-heptose 1-phosphate adenylyltransferase n=1 Tax=Mucilaginibacter jinjuensis TaxID=1176721 RepID=A0ABY7TG64_9SPHI|nr:D-glycero-beta-D-manno-heptose 1-phosphate adenylyltransferase [Mucilaginibacter jinjuensis]WCT14152.1 D-glycero-beta-D-manno-heptose 1-phosphate adenylyltransferase [Mucilaginibacter jinjuensis]